MTTEENKEIEQSIAVAEPAVDGADVATSEESSSAAQEIDKLDPIEEGELSALVEALLFASSEPLTLQRLSEISHIEEDKVLSAIGEIEARLQSSGSGFELIRVASAFQFRSRPIFAPYIRILRSGKPRRLSNAALETLAVVAYRQPVIKSDIEKIRGVDVTPTLKTLLERSLIKIVGHQATVGQPALYGTTDQFLSLFGLNSLSELPTLRDIKEFEREPGEAGSQEGEDDGRLSTPSGLDNDGRGGDAATAG